MRFTVLGDTQGLSKLDQLVVDMNAYNSEFFILPGDLVNTGGSGSWDSWIAKANNFNSEQYMVPGNHDLPVGGNALWQSKFSWLPDSQVVDGKQGIDQMDYFFDLGDTRFISVTTDSQANGTPTPTLV
ncbi:MAG: metallophosphoesterase [Pirellulales bacterium]